ncbi:hypothetical protein HK104_009280 [Borealophlyctis nickersoniae]|nr:hypothetical protein HK104_009280 [Borealophlyctis nickersoniae]
MATKITVSSKATTPPYGVVAAANVIGPAVEVAFDQVEGKDATLSADGLQLSGSNPVLRHFGRAFPEKRLYGGDAVKAAQVDYWLDYVQDTLATANDYKAIAPAFEILNTHLRLRSFVVGHHLTIADFAVWGALRGNSIFVRQLKAGKGIGTYLSRWAQHISSLDFVQKAVDSVEKSKSTVKPVKKDQGSFDINLKDAVMGKVVTRFPPEPSGYLHIGHAKAALLNDYFARTYNGKLIVRFDDTNPTKEKAEFEESIKEDLLLLGIKGDVITYTSDSFDIIYDHAIKLIKKGLAYVDDTDQETMRAERMELRPSKCRDLPVDENLQRFEQMVKFTEFGAKCSLRAKIDYKSENGTLRDPVIYRCNATPHHRTGSKWKVYPTYDFACPIVDSIEGVTHALRTNEYRDRNVQYEWFLKNLELRWVHIWDYSRLNFIYTLLSKRKLTWFVEQGLVSGWDDPRFPTIRGIRRRGMTIEALRQYNLMQGASQRELNVEWDKIWAINKKIIDPVAPRHTAINLDKIVKVNVVGEDVQPHTKEMPKHKKNPDVGMKLTTFSGELYIEFDDAKDLEPKEEVTFMDWGNVIVQSVQWADDRAHIKCVEVKLHLDGDFKKTKKKLTWLSRAETGKMEQTPVKLTLHDYDYLITKKKLEEEDEITDFITPVSEFKASGRMASEVSEQHLTNQVSCRRRLSVTPTCGISRKVKFCLDRPSKSSRFLSFRGALPGEYIQLERKGYYICDRAYEATNPDAPIHLIFIPDGRMASTQSKDEQNETPKGSGPKDQNGGDSQKKNGNGKKDKPPKGNAGGKGPKAGAPKVDGSDSSSVNGIKMYKVKPVYAQLESVDPKSVSKMYTVKSMYGPEEPLPTAAAPGPSKKETPASPAPKEKSAKGGKPAPAPAAAEASLISKLDIVVGKILDVKKHPDADSLYVEQIDCGEEKPREVVSGLVKFMTEDDIRGKTILVLKNLKPASMRGIKSHAMVLCASNADHTKVEFLVPPPGSVPGDRVFFEGHEGEPDEQLNPKKKVFETVQPGFSTGDDLVATWNGIPFQTAKGVVKAASLNGASIK